jgi:Mrp family chromosome partitioning ATPase
MIKTRPSTATLATTPVTARGHVSRIYIASAESGAGKSAIALGLLHLLAASAAQRACAAAARASHRHVRRSRPAAERDL